MFDPKIIITPNFIGIITAGIVGIGTMVGIIAKVMAKNNLSKNEAFKHLQSKSLCNERSSSIEGKIDSLKEHITLRFDDMKDFMIKNGK